MGRVETFLAIGVVIVVAVYSRRLAVDLLGPGTPLFELAASVQWAGIDGRQWALEMYENATVWVPWLIVATAILAGLYKEFLAQNVTRAQVKR